MGFCWILLANSRVFSNIQEAGEGNMAGKAAEDYPNISLCVIVIFPWTLANWYIMIYLNIPIYLSIYLSIYIYIYIIVNMCVIIMFQQNWVDFLPKHIISHGACHQKLPLGQETTATLHATSCGWSGSTVTSCWGNRGRSSRIWQSIFYRIDM